MKQHHKHLLIGFGISAFFLWLAFRNVNFSLLWTTLKQVNYLYVIPFLVVTFGSMYVRALRWHYFLRPARHIRTPRLFPAVIIGFGFNGIFPARAGEFARAYVLSKKETIPFSTSIGTIVVERIFDSLTILISFSVALTFVTFTPGISVEWAGYTLNAEFLQDLSSRMLYVTAFLIFVTIFLILRPTREFLKKGILIMPFIPPKFRNAVVLIVDKFAHGFMSVRDPKSLVLVIIYSLVVWITVGWSVHIMSLGFPTLEMSFAQAYIVMVMICIFVSFPSAPGYWGIYEFGCIISLQLLGVVEGKSDAMGFSLVIHALQMFPLIVLALYFAWRANISISQVTHRIDAEEDAKDETRKGQHPPVS